LTFLKMPSNPESIVAARRLVSNTPGAILFESSTVSSTQNNRSLLFRDPLKWIEVHDLAELPGAFAIIDAALAQGHWVAGYFAYECGYHWEPTAHPNYKPTLNTPPLAVIGVYSEPILCTPCSTQPPPEAGLTNLAVSLTLDQYAQQFEEAQQYISAGDTYQLNLTAEVRAPYNTDPADLFAHMMAAQPVDLGAMLHVGTHHILSASPELFFHQHDREIVVRPMKGTSPRGTTPSDDDRLAMTLAADEKSRAENVMIVDLLRNDLGRISEFGSVHPSKLFTVERLPSLLQMTSEIRATLRPGITPYRLFAALFPSGSIIGAPKVHSMQLIRSLERRDRGVYTGAIGFWSPHGEALFSVAIRTAVLDSGHLTMGVGSGLVADSSALSEYNECVLKADFLRDQTFGLIETMRWQHGRCALLELHLDRLQSSAAHFHFHFDRELIRCAVKQRAAVLDAVTPYKVRLVLDHRGACTFNASEPIPAEDSAPPLRIHLWPTPIHSTNPLLQHKTTRRTLFDHAYAEGRRQGFVDVIFINEHGHITEGAIHNIFVRHGTRWRTPPTSDGLLAGVYRRHLLDTKPNITEASLTSEDLHSADEVWITNAVRGIRIATFAR
jgi:para-aminobenzoate synthetase/4-amino-4-deoxychorismate lyase